MQPKPSRFSLLVLMASIGILGLGLGGMRNGSTTADQIAFSSTLLALLIGLLGALVRREAVAWVGFALFGWACLLLTSVPVLEEAFGDRLLIKYTDPIPEEGRYASVATIAPGESVLFTLDGVPVGPIAASDLLPIG